MNQDEIFNNIVLVCENVFDDSNLNLSLNSSAGDVYQWDSLTHIQLILGIEQKFQMRFSLGELQNLKTIQSLVQLVGEKLE